MTSVISVENLSKKYIIGHQKQESYNNYREEITQGFGRSLEKLIHPFAKANEDITHEEFWALKNVSFDIQQGDRVGLIGGNGAGKSTLLKILSRITEPTSGKVTIKGRVASLLEVGTGFHPELSGRENVFLNGAILGMSKAEIKKMFDEIVAFAEVEKFLDTPVKRYSSGMYVRLAFSVAAHLGSEILIVDEVLGVGDTSFQNKCMEKIEDASNEGRTVLFVSHSMAMISELCQKGILLKQGSVLFQGGISDTLMAYHQDNSGIESAGGSEGKSEDDNRPKAEHESENAKLLSVELILQGEKDDITIHDEILVRMKYRLKKAVDGKSVPNFLLYAIDGTCVLLSSPENMSHLPPGDYCADCKIPGNFLNEGGYFCAVSLTTYMQNQWRDDFFDPNAVTFKVVDPMIDTSSRYGYTGLMPGVVRPKLDWDIRKI
jgi:lipopolysaccharide transport system ATP-binding protein